MKTETDMEFLLENKDALPAHVAIIMDGNGRWAAQRGLPRPEGHRAGARAIKPLLKVCRRLEIRTVTLFAFSTENWQRPDAEVNAIMSLLSAFIEKETAELRESGVRLRFIGSPERLSPELKLKMDRAAERTAGNSDFNLNVCINYGGRDEILRAVRGLMDGARRRELEPEGLNQENFSERLYTGGLPDPDLMIRTGGERRISNFLLWQLAYAEIIFHPKFWPDFTPEDLVECLRDYAGRDRRFGRVAERDAGGGLLEGISSPADLKRLSGEDLDLLAAEMREVIISGVSGNGGHLSSNLGVVELAIALHRVFDSPRDKLIWDVGHQCYPHKLLTGRYRAFDSLRTRGGLSGFPKTSESEHDCFNTGHGSTSVSAALGMAAARDLMGEDFHVAAVCGDGAMSGGMVFEAMNHAGEIGGRLIVVLNDNSYSISPVTGALSRYLSKIRTNAAYVRAHERFHDLKERRSGFFGAVSLLSSPLRRLGKYLAFKEGIVFEELGFTYVGPVDGHNIAEMTDILRKVKKIKGPVLVHVLTRKGKGYGPAEEDPAVYHGVSRLDGEAAPERVDIRPAATFTQVFCDSMTRLCEKDERIVAITAAMSLGTGTQELRDRFPRRVFDVGMAEQHAVTFAAGLAARGMRPVVAIYSTFLQRAYDQIFHDVCLQNLPVVFAVDRAGLVSKYGQTHQGVMDIAYLRHMPNMELLAPRDTVELEAMLEYAMGRTRPVAIRYPAGEESGAVKAGARAPIERAVAETLCGGSDLAIWAVGTMAAPALKAAKILQHRGLGARVINARFVSPMDEKTLAESYREGITRHFTVEEHLLQCGFGSLFLETANRLGLDTLQVTRIGVEHSLIPDDSREALLGDFGLTAEAIAARVLEKFKKTSLKKEETGVSNE